MNVIELQNVTACRPDGAGVTDITLTLQAGQACALLGMPGAGKTALLMLMAGRLTPQSGSCTAVDADVVPALPLFQPQDTPRTLLTAACGTEAEALLGKLRIADPDAAADALPEGERRLVALACAVHGSKPWLLADEPFLQLNAMQIETAVNLLQKAADSGRGVVIATADFDQAERVCTTAVLLRQGKLLAAEPMEEMGRKKHRTYHIHFGENGDAAGCAASGRVTVLETAENRVTAMVKASMVAFLQATASFGAESFSAAITDLEQLAQYHYLPRQ